jgi:cbb3-type cytochrome oxidase subunit 3
MGNISNFFSRLFNLINLPKHIRKFILKRKIRKHTTSDSKRGTKVLKILNGLILIIGLSSIVYLNFIYKSSRILWISDGILGLVLFVFSLWKRRKGKKAEVKESKITRLLLKDEEENIINNWEIYNQVSMLIGKKTKVNEVDIDLSDAIYSSLISRQHGVINKSGDKWYFEDIGSSNGSGIRRRGNNKKFKVAEGRPYQLYSGDIIYIANTKLYVQ